jgi:hypothetical protein
MSDVFKEQGGKNGLYGNNWKYMEYPQVFYIFSNLFVSLPRSGQFQAQLPETTRRSVAYHIRPWLGMARPGQCMAISWFNPLDRKHLLKPPVSFTPWKCAIFVAESSAELFTN